MTATELAPRRSTTASAPRARRPRWRSQRGALTTGLAFLAPFLLVYLAFVVWPVGQALQMSFYDWDLLGYTRERSAWTTTAACCGAPT
jgi:multiple sugar transport system permease protein